MQKVEEMPQVTQPQTMKCFVIPVETMETIIDTVREAPFKTARPVMNLISTLQVMDVPVKQPPIPQAND